METGKQHYLDIPVEEMKQDTYVKNVWKNLDDVLIDGTINQMQCDTRDLHCLVTTDMVDIKDG